MIRRQVAEILSNIRIIPKIVVASQAFFSPVMKLAAFNYSLRHCVEIFNLRVMTGF